MPGFDKSEPLDQGLMTGGALGVCNSGDETADGSKFVCGSGMACRRGWGRGFGGDRDRRGILERPNEQVPAAPAADEKDAPESEVHQLQRSLENILQRLKELEKSK